MTNPGGDAPVTIKRLDLVNYKGFAKFTVRFSGSSYLVGPNNAGKSTIIHALRGCAHMLDYAFARSATDARRDQGRTVIVYPFLKDQFSLVTENVRHEFSPEETRLELVFSNDSMLRVVWPAQSTDEQDNWGPFFYLETSTGAEVTRPTAVQENFVRIGIIPTLMPIDAHEQVLDEKHVRTNIDGRLASRHFRNQIFLLRKRRHDHDGYIDFVTQWTPEITLKDLITRPGPKRMELDLFYRESSSRTDKEIFWAGDGLQIWLQFLLHMHRLKDFQIIVLDEPDVYLHADLQRRVVRVLDASRVQTITATHSAEILGEAGSARIVLVDRTRRQSFRAPSGEQLLALSDALGSRFNLRLARALRARAVVFVEGKDQKILRHLAEKVGAKRFAAEEQVAVIPIDGFSNWDRVVPFKFIVDNLLENSVPVFAILDRDYRSDAEVEEVVEELQKSGVVGIVWWRKELESYLLETKVIAKMATKKNTTHEWVKSAMHRVMNELKDEVLASFLSARKGNRTRKKDQAVPKDAVLVKEFRDLWSNPDRRLQVCPPKDVLAALNTIMQADGRGSVSFQGIARTMEASDVPQDVGSALSRIERAITAGRS